MVMNYDQYSEVDRPSWFPSINLLTRCLGEGNRREEKNRRERINFPLFGSVFMKKMNRNGKKWRENKSPKIYNLFLLQIEQI